MTASHDRSRFWWGLFTRKERWGLSTRGWLVVLVTFLVTVFALLKWTYPFLATTDRGGTDVLVVEGWIHPFAIRAAAEEFRSGHYHQVFTTGGPVTGSGGYTHDDDTYASVGAGLLSAADVPAPAIQSVPSRVMIRDRTYGSAVALRNWFHEHDLPARGINVVTEAVHARRTRLLFEEALGPEFKVGIIGVTNPDYDPRRWWRYSEGFREVVGEAIAYLYAKLFFIPPRTQAANPIIPSPPN